MLGNFGRRKVLPYHVLDENRYGMVKPLTFQPSLDLLLLPPLHFLVDSSKAMYQVRLSSLECLPHHVFHGQDEDHVVF